MNVLSNMKAGRFLLAALFLGFKTYEYHTKFHHMIYPSTGGFWSYYFFMTGFHALHVIIGIIAFLILIGFALAGRLESIGHRVELCGLYWHMVDIIWIILYPLLYLS